jgi:hypothetical protein
MFALYVISLRLRILLKSHVYVYSIFAYQMLQFCWYFGFSLLHCVAVLNISVAAAALCWLVSHYGYL